MRSKVHYKKSVWKLTHWTLSLTLCSYLLFVVIVSFIFVIWRWLIVVIIFIVVFIVFIWVFSPIIVIAWTIIASLIFLFAVLSKVSLPFSLVTFLLLSVLFLSVFVCLFISTSTSSFGGTPIFVIILPWTISFRLLFLSCIFWLFFS